MLEKAHIAAVLTQIKKLGTLHSQSMTFGSLSMNGTPDRYFDGDVRDLWIEFKRVKSIPKRGVIIGDYSELQLKWMRRRRSADNGGNVWGVIGLPDKRVCVQTAPHDWIDGTRVETAISHKQLAQLIMEFCNGSSHTRENETTRIRQPSSRCSTVRSTRR